MRDAATVGDRDTILERLNDGVKSRLSVCARS
jgi:hypothetical protein